VDDLARALTKGVPSCDKPWVGARSLRTKDSRMGLLVLLGHFLFESRNQGN